MESLAPLNLPNSTHFMIMTSLFSRLLVDSDQLLQFGMIKTHIQAIQLVKMITGARKVLEHTIELSQITSMDQVPVMINS